VGHIYIVVMMVSCAWCKLFGQVELTVTFDVSADSPRHQLVKPLAECSMVQQKWVRTG